MKISLILLAGFVLATNAQLNVFPRLPGRITGGQEAAPNQFPYQAGLAIIMGDQQAWCGGSIISDTFILTAAHCTENADAVIVYLGAHNIKEDEPDTIKIRVEKENIIVHENWSMGTLRNDISLIKLPSAIQFNSKIQQINLPKWSQADETFVDKMVVASGWGKDSDQSTSVSPVLRFVEVPVLAKWRCFIRYLGKITDNHICITGSGGKSTCNGDSGGPLVMEEEDGSKTLLGCTSFGLAFGCEIGWPGVFTRVTSYLDWIQENTDIKIRA